MTTKITESVNSLFSALNTFGNEKLNQEAVVVAFRIQHRTLQQNFMRLVIIPILRHLADSYEAGIYDARNESSCELAHRIVQSIESDPYLPFI